MRENCDGIVKCGRGMSDSSASGCALTRMSRIGTGIGILFEYFDFALSVIFRSVLSVLVYCMSPTLYVLGSESVSK